MLALQVGCEDLGSNPQNPHRSWRSDAGIGNPSTLRGDRRRWENPGMSVKVRRQCWVLPFTLLETGSLFFCYILQTVTGISVNVVC